MADTQAPKLSLDPRTTALVLIDLEHGIVSRPQLAPHSGSQVVGNCASLAAALRSAGGTVAYVHVLLDQVLDHPADRPRRDPNAPPPPPEASELVPEAGYQPATDILVAKRQWGAFTGTALDQLLRRRGIKTIVMSGIATNLGVESTARAALDLGYDLVFAEDAMTSISAEAHAFSTGTIFPIMGRVRSTADLINAIHQ